MKDLELNSLKRHRIVPGDVLEGALETIEHLFNSCPAIDPVVSL